jgi:hypothetical protein
VESSGMQQWHKGPVPQTAAIFRKLGESQRDVQEGHHARDHETSSCNSQLVTKNKKMDLVEGTAPS